MDDKENNNSINNENTPNETEKEKSEEANIEENDIQESLNPDKNDTEEFTSLNTEKSNNGDEIKNNFKNDTGKIDEKNRNNDNIENNINSITSEENNDNRININPIINDKTNNDEEKMKNEVENETKKETNIENNNEGVIKNEIENNINKEINDEHNNEYEIKYATGNEVNISANDNNNEKEYEIKNDTKNDIDEAVNDDNLNNDQIITELNVNKDENENANEMDKNNERLVTTIPSLKNIDIDDNISNDEDDELQANDVKNVQKNNLEYDFKSENYINDTDSEENEAEHQAENPDELEEDDENVNNIENEDNNYLFSYGLNVDLSKWYRKPYLGGYRNKVTKIEYFHASTQTTTPQEKRAMGYGPRFHRDTQTHFWKNRYSQSVRDHATQMTKPGCFISNKTDKIIYPKKYITAEEHLNFITENVIKIQCFFRKCKAIRIANELRKERDEFIKMKEEKERKRQELLERKRKKEIQSRLHPRTANDFEILYNGLEAWRIQERDKINNANYPEPIRLAALANLLDQEAILIQKIDKLKRDANIANHERNINNLLNEMSSPKKWTTKKGVVEVDTPSIIRARELKNLYNSLNLQTVSIDERLKILLQIKYKVKEFDCELSREIVKLIDREGDLISRGREPQSMEGLRVRISNLFLQFIKTPEFNPEVALHIKFSDTNHILNKKIPVYYCESCTQYLPSTEFYLTTNMKEIGRCRKCINNSNIATKRENDSYYEEILQLIRTKEEFKQKTKGQSSEYSIINILQENEIKYLIDIIWQKSSAISGNSNLDNLILTRWNQNEPISPWNCILLTQSEAINHDMLAFELDPRKPRKLDSNGNEILGLCDIYKEDFIRKVQQKHRAAKDHFSQLPILEKFMNHKNQKQKQKERQREKEQEKENKTRKYISTAVSTST